MARRRKLSRQKKTAAMIAGIGVFGGLAALILWPIVKRTFQPNVKQRVKIGRSEWDVKLPAGVMPVSKRIYSDEELDYYRQEVAKDPYFASSLPADLRKLL